MKDQEAALLSVNYAIRDSEIEEIEAMLAAADPGEWRVTGGVLARYAGPFERPAESLTFAAKARAIVPRLLKGLRVLEDAYATRRAEVASYRNELAGARLDSRATAERAAAGKTGPSWDLGLVARYAALLGRIARSEDDGDAAYIEQLLRRWTGGESIGDEIRSSVESIERRVKEREVFDAEQAASDSARRDELKGWIRRLEAGDVPQELARSWAKLTAAERKAYLAERPKSR